VSNKKTDTSSKVRGNDTTVCRWLSCCRTIESNRTAGVGYIYTDAGSAVYSYSPTNGIQELREAANSRRSSIGDIYALSAAKEAPRSLSPAVICAISPTTPVSTTYYATTPAPHACFYAAFYNHVAPTPMSSERPLSLKADFVS